MNANNVPPPAPEDPATEQLVAAVESAIGVIHARLSDLDGDRDTKWSVSDLVKLLQLRKELEGQLPSTTSIGWSWTFRESPDLPLNN